MMFFYALLAGFCMDLLFGDPEWLCHPVRLIGKYISFAEKKLRAGGGNLRLCAVLLTLSAVLLTMGTAWLILLAAGRLGKAPLFLAMALLDWMGIAAKSMTQEARQVQQALSQGIGRGAGRSPASSAATRSRSARRK